MWQRLLVSKYLAMRKDGQADGAFFVQHTAYKISIRRLAHGLNHILQGVGCRGVTQQRESQLTAPPTGQVVHSQQPAANMLNTSKGYCNLGLNRERQKSGDETVLS